jgi:hypothetical protein
MSKLSTRDNFSGVKEIHREPRQFTIFAVYKNGVADSLYAVNTNKKTINPIYAVSRKYCEICFRATSGKLFCYDIDTTVLPKRLKPRMN